jgi:hypothetical protein
MIASGCPGDLMNKLKKGGKDFASMLLPFG